VAPTIRAVHDLAVALRDRGDLSTFAGFDRIRAWEEAGGRSSL